MFGLEQYHRHTLNKRMAGYQFNTRLHSVEFLSVSSFVLYVAYFFIVYILLRTLYFFYMTMGTKFVLNNSVLIWGEHILHNM
jgi:hypothetical protein